MRRVLLPILLLAITAAVAVALPCKTHEEAVAEAVVGFFLQQELAAAGCDRLIGGDAFAAQHARIATLYKAQIAKAFEQRAGFFQRAFGEGWKEEHARVQDMMTQVLSTALDITPDNCERLKDELVRREQQGWEKIQARLQRRVEGIAQWDKNLCED